MKKNAKKISSFIIVMSFLILFISSINVYAADDESSETNSTPVVGVYNYSPVSPASSDTYYLGSCTIGGYTYKVNRYYGDWYAIFDLDLSVPYYKGTTAMMVTQTLSKTYSSQTAYEFSISLGGTASTEIIDLTSSITNSVSHTTSVSFEVTSSVSYEIERTDSVGYYKIGVCHDIYRHRVEEYYGTNLINEYDMPTPRGIAYYALLYSSSSDSGYRKN